MREVSIDARLGLHLLVVWGEELVLCVQFRHVRFDQMNIDRVREQARSLSLRTSPQRI